MNRWPTIILLLVMIGALVYVDAREGTSEAAEPANTSVASGPVSGSAIHFTT